LTTDGKWLVLGLGLVKVSFRLLIYMFPCFLYCCYLLSDRLYGYKGKGGDLVLVLVLVLVLCLCLCLCLVKVSFRFINVFVSLLFVLLLLTF
jgi:hypothetical protein